MDRNPSTLIIGENGAGKSTILDALCFGLFGKPFRQISKNQLINTVNSQGTIVEIEFETQNKNVKVVRGIKPNTFEIWVDGNMINQSANAKDYQKHLEQQILKLNYRSFTQVVILGSSTFIPFMQLKSQARREVVEDILDIKIFSLMNLILKGKVKSLNADISENQYQVELNREKVELQENYIEDIERNKDTLLSQKTTLRDGNEEEVFSRKEEANRITEENQTLLDAMSGEDAAVEKRDKLKDIQFTLKDKHSRHMQMIEFLENNHEADNWLLQIETFDPHEPFTAPMRFRNNYKTNWKGGIRDWPKYGRVEELEDEYNELRSNYFALLELCDEQLGRVLDYFDQNDLWADTGLVVTTDHGFLLGEHDFWAKNRMKKMAG